jgi:hypothetical protein
MINIVQCCTALKCDTISVICDHNGQLQIQEDTQEAKALSAILQDIELTQQQQTASTGTFFLQKFTAG